MSAGVNGWQEVPGLWVRHDYVSPPGVERLEAQVRELLEGAPRADNHERSRVRRYGWNYLNAAEWLGPVPLGLTASGVDPGFYESVTVNEYEPGHGLGMHRDLDTFGEPVLVLSLGGEATMRFRRGEREVAFLVRAGTLVTMREESRWAWTHGMDGDNSERRWSIVYRRRLDSALGAAHRA